MADNKIESALTAENSEKTTEKKSESIEYGEEIKVKLDKKTKAVFIAIFLVIICIAIAGGFIISLRSSPTQKKPFEYPSEIDSASLTNSIITETSPLTSIPVTEPVTPAPSTVITTIPQSAVTALPTVAQTTGATAAETQITSFNIDTSEFNRLAKILYGLGFVYNAEENMFFTPNDPWQRNMGYTAFYDDMSVLADMYFDTVRFNFKYGDKKWLFQIWKGRYGATSGCEMGIYYQDRRTENKRFYDIPTDDDPLPGMYFELYRYEDLMFKNGPARHWWLTGFRLLDSSGSEALRMNCKYYMPNTEMCDAFEVAVKEQCALNSKLTYIREKDTITIDWAY